jgi:hypothetical protein
MNITKIAEGIHKNCSVGCWLSNMLGKHATGMQFTMPKAGSYSTRLSLLRRQKKPWPALLRPEPFTPRRNRNEKELSSGEAVSDYWAPRLSEATAYLAGSSMGKKQTAQQWCPTRPADKRTNPVQIVQPASQTAAFTTRRSHSPGPRNRRLHN